MRGRGALSMLIFATSLASGCGAPNETEKAGPAASETRPASKASSGAEGPVLDPADQIAPRNGGDPTRVEGISSAGEADVAVEQTAGGRDLCDPSVSEAERRAAGVDCTAKVEARTTPPPRSLAEDPLLQPNNSEIKKDIEDLGLGEDVPPTVILQQ